jgi:hypothetical protein
MSVPTLFRDYETKSTQDLKRVGAWKYARHPDTDVWCCGYALDDSNIKLWTPGDPIPEEFTEAANDPDWIVSSFNDAFERRVEQHIMTPRYGWPLVPLARHRCSQAAALALALPAALEKVAAALDLPQQKDQAGHRLMLQMSRPRAPRQHENPNTTYWFDDPDRRARLYGYCKQDVATERAIAQRIPGQGKSSLLQQLCVAHAIGSEWLGCRPVRRPSIYIECEDSERVLHWRLTAIAAHYKVTLTTIADAGFQMFPLTDEESAILALALSVRARSTIGSTSWQETSSR